MVGIGDHQSVETGADLGDQRGLEAAVDLPGSGCSCGGDGAHQAVRSGTSDLLCLEVVEGLTEQDRLGVVLERPHQQPVAERAPFAEPRRFATAPAR
jgi:hypothetical protein